MGFYSSGINWWDIEEAAEFFERPFTAPAYFPEEDGPFVPVRCWRSLSGDVSDLVTLPTDILLEISSYLQQVVNVKPKCVIFGIAPQARLEEIYRELTKRGKC